MFINPLFSISISRTFVIVQEKYASRSMLITKNTSMCRMNFSAIRIASRYCPSRTCRSMSEMHAALDSSNAEDTGKTSNLITKFLGKGN